MERENDGTREMVFSSLLVLFYFLPFVLALYFVAPKGFRNGILFFFSLIFYAWGEPVYVILMLFSILLNFTAGYVVEKYKRQEEIKKAQMVLVISVVVNLLLLGIFKYSDFVVENLNHLTGLSVPLPRLELPIGISFYTFQAMSYAIDVYRGEAERQTNVIAFGAYVTLFPQLIAGPIVRYQTVAEELTGRRENLDDFSQGCLLYTSRCV